MDNWDICSKEVSYQDVRQHRSYVRLVFLLVLRLHRDVKGGTGRQIHDLGRERGKHKARTEGKNEGKARESEGMIGEIM